MIQCKAPSKGMMVEQDNNIENVTVHEHKSLLCKYHPITVLWSTDTLYPGRFDSLKNPLSRCTHIKHRDDVVEQQYTQ